MKLSILISFLILTIHTYAQVLQPETAFRIPEKDLIPEGITYSSTTGNFYVGSMAQGKIIKIDKSGNATDFVEKGTFGEWGFIGLKADDDNQVLWACRHIFNSLSDSFGYSSILKLDLKTGKLIKDYTLKKSEHNHLLNDIAIVGNTIYITNSEEGSVYKISAKTDELEAITKPETFFYPNGIAATPDNKYLIVATGGGLFRMDVSTNEVTPIESKDYFIIGIDGLAAYGNTFIGLQSIIKPESIYQFVFDESFSQVIDIKVISTNHPEYNKITTGSIKDDHLYFIANSHLQQLDEFGKIKNMSKLRNPVIKKIKLN